MKKVVIAEDDLMIADMVEEVLLDHGYEVCGIARTVEAAVDLCLVPDRPEKSRMEATLSTGEPMTLFIKGVTYDLRRDQALSVACSVSGLAPLV